MAKALPVVVLAGFIKLLVVGGQASSQVGLVHLPTSTGLHLEIKLVIGDDWRWLGIPLLGQY